MRMRTFSPKALIDPDVADRRLAAALRTEVAPRVELVAGVIQYAGDASWGHLAVHEHRLQVRAAQVARERVIAAGRGVLVVVARVVDGAQGQDGERAVL